MVQVAGGSLSPSGGGANHEREDGEAVGGSGWAGVGVEGRTEGDQVRGGGYQLLQQSGGGVVDLLNGQAI